MKHVTTYIIIVIFIIIIFGGGEPLWKGKAKNSYILLFLKHLDDARKQT